MAFPYVVGLAHGMQNRVAATQNHPLGTLGQTPDGKIWVYNKASSTEIAAGLFVTTISTPVNEQTVTVAHPAGTRTVTVTASGATLDQYKDGYLVVTAGADAGSVYRIKSNTAADSNLIQVTLHDNSGLNVAWSTSTTDVDLFVNPYSAAVICPTDGQQLAVAVTQRIVPASNYFWGLKEGPGAFMCDNAGAATGLELDEKKIHQSLNHAGQGFIEASPDATKILAGWRQVCGYLITEEDTVDNEMEFGMFRL